MKKLRKFSTDGYVKPAALDADSEEQDARNRNDAAEAMLQIDAVETPKVSAKPKVVTKEELAKSGLSLRDYMNKQQGLTRRGETTPAPAPSVSSNDRRMRDAGTGLGPTLEKAQALKAAQSPKLQASNSKSVLEKYDAKGNRRMPTAEEGALEGSYPVESMAGGAASLLKTGVSKLAGRGGAKSVAEPVRIEPTMTSFSPPSKLSAAKKAKLAGELRRGEQPTKFTSPSKSAANKKTRKFNEDEAGFDMKKGGAVKTYAAGGAVSSRADGIAQRGKTRCKVC
jgi:hypothetical protein